MVEPLLLAPLVTIMLVHASEIVVYDMRRKSRPSVAGRGLVLVIREFTDVG